MISPPCGGDSAQGKAGEAPFGRQEVVSISRETSPGAGQAYGLERVCRVLESPRSTIHAQQTRETNVVPLHSQRRGPKPKLSDANLLVAIRPDLAASPFAGEGHRKVWARLRILHSIRVSKDRVCRLMCENALLSPHRVPQGAPSLHEGSIQTEAPNLMWGTDGIRIETVEDGWVWGFSAVAISMPAVSACMP